MSEPDWTEMDASESWPVLVHADFGPDLTLEHINHFAEWLDGIGGPGPCRRTTYFRGHRMDLAFPPGVDPDVVTWWEVELARHAPVSTVRRVAG